VFNDCCHFYAGPGGRRRADGAVAGLSLPAAGPSSSSHRQEARPLSYRGCRLSRPEDSHRLLGSTRVKAGDRAPDVAFRKADTGSATTLFQLLQPMRPIVLISPGPAQNGDQVVQAAIDALMQCGVDAFIVTSPESSWCARHSRTLIDMHGDLRTVSGMTGQFLCLIRPDDHVGLFQRPIKEPALRAYLARIIQLL
jgi:hypothetical protein